MRRLDDLTAADLLAAHAAGVLGDPKRAAEFLGVSEAEFRTGWTEPQERLMQDYARVALEPPRPSLLQKWAALERSRRQDLARRIATELAKDGGQRAGRKPEPHLRSLTAVIERCWRRQGDPAGTAGGVTAFKTCVEEEYGREVHRRTIERHLARLRKDERTTIPFRHK